MAGTEGDDPALVVRNSIFFDIGGPGGEAWFEAEPVDGSADDDDGGFVEADFFLADGLNNQLGTDPELAAPYDIASPGFAPANALDSNSTGADFNGASYVGAIDPAGDDWVAGWTAFP